MNEIQLKACPFCGSTRIGLLERNADIILSGNGVVCADCGGGIVSLKRGADQAIAAWNARAGGQQPEAKPNDDALASSLKRVVRPRLVNQYLAQAATERVARRVQEIEGRWDEPASLDMKATIYHEILEVLNNGVEV